MRSDWAYVHDTIERSFIGKKLDLLTDEELHSFADALDNVFQDVVFVIVARRIHALEDGEVTPGAQGGYIKANT